MARRIWIFMVVCIALYMISWGAYNLVYGARKGVEAVEMHLFEVAADQRSAFVSDRVLEDLQEKDFVRVATYNESSGMLAVVSGRQRNIGSLLLKEATALSPGIKPAPVDSNKSACPYSGFMASIYWIFEWHL